jgi:hypothetical protein
MLIFNKYFYKIKKSKLYFGDRVAVLNDFIYQTGGSTSISGVSKVPSQIVRIQYPSGLLLGCIGVGPVRCFLLGLAHVSVSYI